MNPETAFHVSTWNVEWAPPAKRDAVRGRVARFCPARGVFVLTEGDRAVLPSDGHVVEGGPDWDYREKDPDRRKVILWSDIPLSDPDSVGSPALPRGRFAAATLDHPAGPVRVIAVCIPWHNAHVSTGRGDAAPWEEHIAYLEALAPVLQDARRSMPVCVVGDFNQRIPSTWVSRAARAALEDAFTGFNIPTAGEPVPGLLEQAVDHVAVTEDLVLYNVAGLDRLDEPPPDGRRPRALSDHHLISCSLMREP